MRQGSALSTQQILAKLISFDTVSSKSNLELITWIQDYLAGYGVKSQRIDAVDAKCSLIACIGDTGKSGQAITANQGGIVFSGHTDVVPVVDQPWTQDPFTLWQANGRYYGRGACDMKGFIACVLSQVPNWVQLKLNLPVYLAFTRDEEIGCLGAEGMAQYLDTSNINKPLVIIGEPTLMQPVVAQKGITSFITTVYGEAAHSSQVTQGLSAVHVASHLVYEIEKVMGKMVADGEVDYGFNIPYSSLHVGIISGGTAINVKARECKFEWEIRHLPSQTVEDIMARVDRVIDALKHKYPKLKIETVKISKTVPALENRDNDHIVKVVTDYLNNEQPPKYVAYATEAGVYQKHGFEVVILGPGSIEQAHQPDEWVEISQIEACNAFLRALVAGYCV